MCTHEAYYTLLFCTLETMLLWWREEHIFTQIFWIICTFMPFSKSNNLIHTAHNKITKKCKNNNSQGPDKLNIKHLKHIGPLGLAFLTSMFKTALNRNRIPHTWKLINIVPIPKPDKDTDKGTSHRPISLLSVIADTGEEPSSLHNSKHTKHTHATRVQNTTLYSDCTTHTK